MKEFEGKNGGTLIRVEKGDPSPNPNGRPKGSLNTKTIIRRWLSAVETAKNALSGEDEDLTQLDIITIAQIVKARNGDTFAFNALLDRTDGKPKQFTELSGSEGAMLPSSVDYSKLPTEVLQAILDARVTKEETVTMKQNDDGTYEAK